MNTLNNSVRLIGFLGSAPGIKLTENQKKYVKLDLATNGFIKNKNGECVTETTWHELLLWDKQAELAEKYLNKGSKIFLEGKISDKYYTDKDCVKRYATGIIINEIYISKKNQD